VNGNFNHMQFTGDDFFKDKNVCSIVLELFNSELGTNKVESGLDKDKTADGWIQADRGGDHCRRSSYPEKRKMITFSESRQMMIASSAPFAHELEHSQELCAARRQERREKIVADILRYDPREAVRYPHNGRTQRTTLSIIFFSIYKTQRFQTRSGRTGSAAGVSVCGPPHKLMKQRKRNPCPQ